MTRKVKRYNAGELVGEAVGDSNEGMKEERDAYDASQAAEANKAKEAADEMRERAKAEGARDANKIIESKHQLIEINENHSIFNWRKVFENAQNICLVDSAVSNFVEQLNIKCKKTLIQKKGQPIATYNNNWRIIQE